jgi:heterotetrameric sarcosine oxidase delta subunit
MLRIRCPWCGERDQTEFRFGGQAHINRPEDPANVSDAEWANYLFYRDNPKGVHCERWVHNWGCRQWFNVARHTVTHEILQVYAMGEPPPAEGVPIQASEA